jgi:hypothetical protein
MFGDNVEVRLEDIDTNMVVSEEKQGGAVLIEDTQSAS